jgi:hypothetical protein
MFKLNQTVLVDSPSTALQNESGIFELVSPLGDIIQLACEPGLELGTPQRVSFDPKRKRSDQRWEIKKIAELPGNGRPQPEAS